MGVWYKIRDHEASEPERDKETNEEIKIDN